MAGGRLTGGRGGIRGVVVLQVGGDGSEWVDEVGIDVGLFSIMKTVWQYDKSPDPIPLAETSIGAKGNVHAGPDGFRGTMTPEYKPPELSIEKLKRALHL